MKTLSHIVQGTRYVLCEGYIVAYATTIIVVGFEDKIMCSLALVMCMIMQMQGNFLHQNIQQSLKQHHQFLTGKL